MLGAYYEKLGDFEPEILEEMRHEASDFHVDFFPSAGQLKRIAQGIASRARPNEPGRRLTDGFSLTEDERAQNQERIREIVAGLSGKNLQ